MQTTCTVQRMVVTICCQLLYTMLYIMLVGVSVQTTRTLELTADDFSYAPKGSVDHPMLCWVTSTILHQCLPHYLTICYVDDDLPRQHNVKLSKKRNQL